MHIRVPNPIEDGNLRIKAFGSDWENHFSDYKQAFFVHLKNTGINCTPSIFIDGDRDLCNNLTNEFIKFQNHRNIECYYAINENGLPIIDKSQDDIEIYDIIVEISSGLGKFFMYFALSFKTGIKPEITSCNLRALKRVVI